MVGVAPCGGASALLTHTQVNLAPPCLAPAQLWIAALAGHHGTALCVAVGVAP